MESATNVNLVPILFSGGVFLYMVGFAFTALHYVKNFEQSTKKACDEIKSATQILEDARRVSDICINLPTLTTREYKKGGIEEVIGNSNITDYHL